MNPVTQHGQEVFVYGVLKNEGMLVLGYNW